MSRPAVSGQRGRFSNLSPDQIASIRRIYRDYMALLALRTQLCHELNISTQYFCRVGNGTSGKKPRVQA